MPQLDSDSFTYANGGLAAGSSGKWTQLSGYLDPTIASNTLANGAGVAAAVIASWSGSQINHYSQFAITTTGTGSGGTTVRSDAVSTLYTINVTTTGGDTIVYKVIAGVVTSLSAVTITWAIADVVYMEMQGDTIITKQNGTTRHNFTDSSIASGKPGVQMDANPASYDDWAAGGFVEIGIGRGNPVAEILRPFHFHTGRR